MDAAWSSDQQADASVLELIITKDCTISGRHGPVRARVYGSSSRGLQPGLVWLHGGGFIGGDLEMPEADWVARSIAADGLRVVSGDYRTCLDGVHYPIPNDDVLDLWMWVAEHATELGIDPARIHLGGASAGAALAATVAKRLRDGAGMAPTSIVLVYPVLHYELPEPPSELRALLQEHAEVVLTPQLVRSISDNYAGGSDVARDPYAFAANGDLSGLSPTFILNSEIDSLRVSGELYGADLSRAGTEVLIQYEPGALHGHLNEPFEPPAQRSIARMVSWLRTH